MYIHHNIVKQFYLLYHIYFLIFGFFKKYIFNWKIIALQYCVSFCHTSTWISHSIHMSPPLWTSLPPPTSSHASRLSQSTRSELPVSYSKFPLAIYFTYSNVYVSMLLFQFVPPSPSPNPCVHKSVLCVFISIASLQIGSSLPSF